MCKRKRIQNTIPLKLLPICTIKLINTYTTRIFPISHAQHSTNYEFMTLDPIQDCKQTHIDPDEIRHSTFELDLTEVKMR